MRLAGIVLAGGTAQRMGGIDKAAIEVDGRTLLTHALDALTEVDEVVVVAPHPAPTRRPVRFTMEDPPHGGPAAGLLTGLDALEADVDLVVVLAVDMPRVGATTVRRLVEAARGRDGAFLTDADGRRQLAGVVRAERLALVRPAREARHGMSMRALLDGLDLAAVAPDGAEGRDVDRWSDLRALRDPDGGCEDLPDGRDWTS